MKFRFKHQTYQAHAVEAVVDCFNGQPNTAGISYRIDPGEKKRDAQGYYQKSFFENESGFKNADLALTEQQILEKIQTVQKNQGLPQSQSINEFKTIKKDEFVFDKAYTNKALAISFCHLDVEMETGTRQNLLLHQNHALR